MVLITINGEHVPRPASKGTIYLFASVKFVFGGPPFRANVICFQLIQKLLLVACFCSYYTHNTDEIAG